MTHLPVGTKVQIEGHWGDPQVGIIVEVDETDDWLPYLVAYDGDEWLSPNDVKEVK